MSKHDHSHHHGGPQSGGQQHAGQHSGGQHQGHDHDSHGHGHSTELTEVDWERMADHVELENEVFLAYVTDSVTRAVALRPPTAGVVRSVLDVGCGPGVSSVELARLFPDATVVALDSSTAMLKRAQARIDAHALGTRLRTYEATLPEGLSGLGPCDVIWASMSLHHVGDEVGVVRALGKLLAPHGVLVIAEMADSPRIIPEPPGIGRPGLAARVDEAGAQWFAHMRSSLPGSTPSSAFDEMVNAAGLTVVASTIERQRIDAPLPEAARRVAIGIVRRVAEHIAAPLDEDDRAALARLADPNDSAGLLQRDDVNMETSRLVVIATHD